MIVISVITVCLNAVDGVRSTARSLIDQSFESFEWIVIDGGSTDDTIVFLSELSDLRIRYISEPDGGIYEAMNKGLTKAVGKWIIFLGAGDTFYSVNTLSSCSLRLDGVPTDYSFAYGGVSYRGTSDDVYYWDSIKSSHYEALSFSVPPHSSTFLRGGFRQWLFDPTFSIIGDRLFMLLNSNGRF